MTGIKLIAKERQEQIEKHGYDAFWDLSNNSADTLIWAAKSILDNNPDYWPNKWSKHVFDHIIKKPKVEQLAVAGAFIAAQIDRYNAILKVEQTLS